jgi:hypothetical protein
VNRDSAVGVATAYGQEGLGKLKQYPVTSSGIEPTTFRLVASCLKQRRYCVHPPPHTRFPLQSDIYFLN